MEKKDSKNEYQEIVSQIESEGYELTVIGQSNRSKIFNILDAKTKEEKGIALKIIPHKHHSSKDHIEQCYHLQNEYDQLMKMSHPNLVEVYSCEILQTENSQACALQLEKCKADILSMIRKKFPNIFDIDQFRLWFLQICSALQYMQKKFQMYHFDIKPENIFLKNTKVAKLGDFGFACQEKDIKEQRIKEIFNNRSNLYMPPEIIELENELEKKKRCQRKNQFKKINWGKVDVFSMGVTMFSCLFLTSPFKNESALPNDPQYKYIKTKQFDLFWKSNENVTKLEEIYRQQEHSEIDLLKDLLQKMMAYHPIERISINEVLNHPWFQ